MNKLLLIAGCAAAAACGQREEAAPANDGNAAFAGPEANTAATAASRLNETSWEFTRDGKALTESIDASGNYIVWSGNEHIDHGTAVMKEGKACFDSAMDQEGETCWDSAISRAQVGQSFETTSDKGETLMVTRIVYLAPPRNVMP